jgi:AraC-like DNA-binding protein
MHEIAVFGEIAPHRHGKLQTVINLLDLFLRSTGIAFGLVLMLVVGARGGWRERADLLAVIGCTCAYLVCATPSRPCCGSPSFLPLILGAIGFPFALWRLARVVLEDDRRVPALAWMGLVMLLTSGVLAAADYLESPLPWRMAFGGVNKVAAFGFVGGALLTAWRTWDGDLVEPRRRLRWVLVTYLGAFGLTVLIGEVYLLGRQPPAWLDALNVAMIDLTLLATLLFLVDVRAQAMATLFDPAAASQPGTAARDSVAPPPSVSVSRPDEHLLSRLQALMNDERLYRDQDLSVGSLAARLAVPEYVLRRLIHNRLGCRNFAAFVNEYRLREVHERLSDPGLDRRPILTLALEAGFGSVGPFNRLFRDRYGMTPSEFRARKLSEATTASDLELVGASNPAATTLPIR